MPIDDSKVMPLIEAGISSKEEWLAFLKAVLEAFDCQTGTCHTLDPATGELALEAHQGIPDELIPVITSIPIGKGIAGAAAERREAVHLCNLQTDDSGVSRPGAKKTHVAGSVAIPIQSGDKLKGTLGIGKYIPYDFTEEELAALWKIGNSVADKLP